MGINQNFISKVFRASLIFFFHFISSTIPALPTPADISSRLASDIFLCLVPICCQLAGSFFPLHASTCATVAYLPPVSHYNHYFFFCHHQHHHHCWHKCLPVTEFITVIASNLPPLQPLLTCCRLAVATGVPRLWLCADFLALHLHLYLHLLVCVCCHHSTIVLLRHCHQLAIFVVALLQYNF